MACAFILTSTPPTHTNTQSERMRLLLMMGGLLPLAAAFAAVPTAAAPSSSSSSSSFATAAATVSSSGEAKQHGTPTHRGLERKTDFVILEEIPHDPSAFT